MVVTICEMVNEVREALFTLMLYVPPFVNDGQDRIIACEAFVVVWLINVLLEESNTLTVELAEIEEFPEYTTEYWLDED